MTAIRCEMADRLEVAVPVDHYFRPQQELNSKVRDGAKVTKKYDTATTPFHRATDHPKHDQRQHREYDLARILT